MDQQEIFHPDQQIGSLETVTTLKSLELIFVVDNSGSMREAADSAGTTRIEAVNQAFRELIPNLQELQEQRKDSFKIYISIMLFNEDPEWFTYSEPISTYVFQEIPVSPYVTYYSRAFQELGDNLNRQKIFTKDGKRAEPFIMFMTDGAPSEGDDYHSVLQGLQNNGWFVNAQRYAVLIGDDVIQDPNARAAVSAFVKNEREGIIDAPDAKAILAGINGKTMIIVDNMTQRGNAAGGAGEGPGYHPAFPGESPFPPSLITPLTGGTDDDPWKNFSGGSPFDPSLKF